MIIETMDKEKKVAKNWSGEATEKCMASLLDCLEAVLKTGSPTKIQWFFETLGSSPSFLPFTPNARLDMLEYRRDGDGIEVHIVYSVGDTAYESWMLCRQYGAKLFCTGLVR